MRVIQRHDFITSLPPKNEEEKMWKKQHNKELKQIKEAGKCLCGQAITKENPLIDLGYKYGFECLKCR